MEDPMLPSEAVERFERGQKEAAEQSGGQVFGGQFTLGVFRPDVAQRIMSWPVWEADGGREQIQNPDGTFTQAFLARIGSQRVPGEG